MPKAGYNKKGAALVKSVGFWIRRVFGNGYFFGSFSASKVAPTMASEIVKEKCMYSLPRFEFDV